MIQSDDDFFMTEGGSAVLDFIRHRACIHPVFQLSPCFELMAKVIDQHTLLTGTSAPPFVMGFVTETFVLGSDTSVQGFSRAGRPVKPETDTFRGILRSGIHSYASGMIMRFEFLHGH